MFSNASRGKNPHNIYQPFCYKEDYESNTNEKNCNTDDLQYENDNFIKNLDKEQDYKEDYECKEEYYMVNKTNLI